MLTDKICSISSCTEEDDVIDLVKVTEWMRNCVVACLFASFENFMLHAGRESKRNAVMMCFSAAQADWPVVRENTKVKAASRHVSAPLFVLDGESSPPGVHGPLICQSYCEFPQKKQ